MRRSKKLAWQRILSLGFQLKRWKQPGENYLLILTFLQFSFCTSFINKGQNYRKLFKIVRLKLKKKPIVKSKMTNSGENLLSQFVQNNNKKLVSKTRTKAKNIFCTLSMANSFHAWLIESRAILFESSGTLEDQYRFIDEKSHEVSSQVTRLKQIEELGSRLEEHFIFDNKYGSQ